MLAAAPPAARLAAFELLAEAAAGAPLVIHCRGSSMVPTIPWRARVRLDAGRRVVLGDVVAARCCGTLLVHRVVGLDGGGRALLKGDACASADGWVEPQDVIGVVTAIERAAADTTVLARVRRAAGRVVRRAAQRLAGSR